MSHIISLKGLVIEYLVARTNILTMLARTRYIRPIKNQNKSILSHIKICKV